MRDMATKEGFAQYSRQRSFHGKKKEKRREMLKRCTLKHTNMRNPNKEMTYSTNSGKLLGRLNLILLMMPFSTRHIV